MIFSQEECRDFARSSRLEWLLTNGAGGYAMGTVAGVRTRRYHGLLIAALRPPVERHLLLARVDELVEPDLQLATTQYPGVVSPRGYLRLLGFRRSPQPAWIHDLGGAVLEKSVRLVPGEATVVLTYRCTARRRISLAPFLAFRDHHSLGHRNDSLDPSLTEERAGDVLTVRAKPYATLPALTFRLPARASLQRDGGWYFNEETLLEYERGMDYREDLYKACTFSLDLFPGVPVSLLATAESQPHLAAFEAGPPPDPLERAAGQFLVRRKDGSPTVIAGYPWFTDWGRDTMISLPGLLLARKRFDEAKEVLRGFLRHLDRGVIPNRFPDDGAPPEYNTVDATLWLFQAVRGYLAASSDDAFVRDELLPAAREIIRWHKEGTHHDIHVDPADGLLAHGPQLTWMDAMLDGHAFTPRAGKAVEINALWVSALQCMSEWGEKVEPPREAFIKTFWNGEYLDDVAGDRSLRPNQLIAVPLLEPAQRLSVVDTVRRHLLTPYGLRTLSPDDPRYVGRYEGDRARRDGAYHQGTVWPWLMGPYVRAYLSAHGKTPETVSHCRALLEPLRAHLAENGSVAEIFDGDAPHAERGCPAQAWSVAELYQLWHVDLA